MLVSLSTCELHRGCMVVYVTTACPMCEVVEEQENCKASVIELIDKNEELAYQAAQRMVELEELHKPANLPLKLVASTL